MPTCPKPLDRVRKTFFRIVSLQWRQVKCRSAVNDTAESNHVVLKKQAAAEQKA
jgi:hypothetical protein